MDFLDPQKQKQHRIRLILGYTLMGLTLLMATIILLYRAYGFGLDSHGRVIQNGFVFISSHPSGADIFMNGTRYSSQTDSRVQMPAGQYTFELHRSGYRAWRRAITSEGGSVQRFDYPFLFPESLKTTSTKQYSAQPIFTSQSPDQRWLLVEPAGSGDMEVFDLNAKRPTAQVLVVPIEILSAGTTTTQWQEVEWSKDNRHVLLQRNFQQNGTAGVEDILLDRQDPSKSVNLSQTIGFTPTTITMRDGDYDQYYAYDANNATLFTASLDQPTPQLLLSNVLAFSADGAENILYITADKAPAGKVFVRLLQDQKTYTIRQLAAGSSYMVHAGTYDGKLYVAVGAAIDNKVYVYKNPVADLQKDASQVLVPVTILKVLNPTYLSASASNRMILIESGDSFAVYDAQNSKSYAYQLKLTLDASAPHAIWMDSFHLTVFSGSQLMAFDFDGANRQKLITTNPIARPYFDQDYTAMYTLSIPQASGAVTLQSTALLTPEDQ